MEHWQVSVRDTQIIFIPIGLMKLDQFPGYYLRMAVLFYRKLDIWKSDSFHSNTKRKGIISLHKVFHINRLLEKRRNVKNFVSLTFGQLKYPWIFLTTRAIMVCSYRFVALRLYTVTHSYHKTKPKLLVERSILYFLCIQPL
jgi:hypothetical protein